MAATVYAIDLLVDLAVVHLLLKRAGSNEAVDAAALLLSVSVHATHSLCVVARVPRCVEQHNAIGANQIDAEPAKRSGAKVQAIAAPAGLGGQQKYTRIKVILPRDMICASRACQHTPRR